MGSGPCPTQTDLFIVPEALCITIPQTLLLRADEVIE
jgi:hypothetical protein